MSANEAGKCGGGKRKKILRTCISSDLIPHDILESQRERLVVQQEPRSCNEAPQQPRSCNEAPQQARSCNEAPQQPRSCDQPPQNISQPSNFCECELCCPRRPLLTCCPENTTEQENDFEYTEQPVADEYELCAHCHEQLTNRQPVESESSPVQNDEKVPYEPCASTCEGCCKNYSHEVQKNISKNLMTPHGQTDTCLGSHSTNCSIGVPCVGYDNDPAAEKQNTSTSRTLNFQNVLPSDLNRSISSKTKPKARSEIINDTEDFPTSRSPNIRNKLTPNTTQTQTSYTPNVRNSSSRGTENNPNMEEHDPISTYDKSTTYRISYGGNVSPSSSSQHLRKSDFRNAPLADTEKDPNIREFHARNNADTEKALCSKTLSSRNASTADTNKSPTSKMPNVRNDPVLQKEKSVASQMPYVRNGPLSSTDPTPGTLNLRNEPVSVTENSQLPNGLAKRTQQPFDTEKSRMLRTSNAKKYPLTYNQNKLSETCPEPCPYKIPTPTCTSTCASNPVGANHQNVMTSLDEKKKNESNQALLPSQTRAMCCGKEECFVRNPKEISPPIVTEVADATTSVTLIPKEYLCEICSKTDSKASDDANDMPLPSCVRPCASGKDSKNNIIRHNVTSPNAMPSHSAMSQSFGELLPIGNKDAEVDTRNSTSLLRNKVCLCQFPPAYSMFGCSGKITGTCDCDSQ